MQGSSNVQTIPMVNGMKLALAQAGNKAGKFTVNFTALDDSTAAAGKWDPAQTAANARKVAADPKAVYYIGEFNSGASEISIPILNQAGIPQVSPANTYVSLTTDLPGSAPGEPQKYYPTGKRTYLRIVPIDSIQGAADLLAMKQAGCTKVAIANDKEAYGAGLAQLIELEKAEYGVNVVSSTGIDPTASNFRSYAQTIKSEGANCFFFSGIVSNGSAAGGAWLTERKGYGERLGLLFGLVLSAVGLILALVLPGRPGSKWKREGPFPRQRRVTGR
jgi:branched-chain amino acid transport system substrate-binding protein